MRDRSFDWAQSRQFNTGKILLAVFLPSGIGLAGFHVLLPYLVQQGMPPMLAWPLVAAVGLLGLVIVAILMLRREAMTMKISFLARACVTRVSKQRWLFYIALAFVVVVITGVLQPVLLGLWSWFDYQPPAYYPFFLRGVDPSSASMDVISPGLPLSGQYWLLPLMAVVLLLNILAEELYFRAWLLPRMHWLGKWSWFWNGILFALYHTFQLWIFPIILVASLVFAFVIWHGRSIVPAMVMHLVLNFISSMLGLTMLIVQ